MTEKGPGVGPAIFHDSRGPISTLSVLGIKLDVFFAVVERMLEPLFMWHSTLIAFTPISVELNPDTIELCMTVELGFLNIVLFIISLVEADAAVPSFCHTADPIIGASPGKQGSSESILEEIRLLFGVLDEFSSFVF